MTSGFRHAYFDCQYGVSGNMILGALLDLGLSQEALHTMLSALLPTGWTMRIERLHRCGIGALHVIVDLKENAHHRSFHDIKELIERSQLPEIVKTYSVNAFQLLAQAESTVHGMDIEHVHFHEVGAVDAIIDIVGSMWGLNELGYLGNPISSSPVSVGGGLITTMHGVMPVPAPATIKMLEGALIKSGPVEQELATPTGVAILRTICGGAERMGQPMDFRIGKVGYGAGSNESPGHTNYLRLVLADTKAEAFAADEVALIECEIDDMTSELLGDEAERLMALGALDVHLIPVQMKKFRPGVSLRMICAVDKVDKLSEHILKSTTTFGVRVRRTQRRILHRMFATVTTVYGTVKIKQGYWGNALIKAIPEYEDCKQLAEQNGVSVREVYTEALKACGKPNND